MRYFKVTANIDDIRERMPELYKEKFGLISSEEDAKHTYIASDEGKIIETIQHYPEFKELDENPISKVDEENRKTGGNLEHFRS